MAAEGYSYEFVSGTPPEDYVCAICTFVARDPHQVNCCGGLFCKGCLYKLENTYKEPSCPLCRKNLTNKYFKDWRAERNVNNLEVYCTNKAKGCTWDGKISEVERHLDICGCVTVECSGCGEELLRKHLDSHLADQCSERKIPCPNCKVVDTYKFVTSANHIDECPDVTVECPNEGCGEEMLRKAVDSHSKVCPKEMVSCTYAIAGCPATMTRESVAEHENRFMQDHLHMSINEIQQKDTKIREQDVKIQQLQTKIQELIQSSKNRYTHQKKPRTTSISVKDFKNNIGKDLKPCCLPFYYSEPGYKMCAGIDLFDSTYMGFYLYLSPGLYDDALEWPFRGSITVELLNQVENKYHYKQVFSYSGNEGKRPIEGSSEGWGLSKFIAYTDLVKDNPKYLMNDTLCFRVTMDTHFVEKTWLKATL